MQAVNLKLKMYAKNARAAGAVNHNLERAILRFIIASFGVLAILYIFFLYNMVSNIVARRNLEASARVLSNEVKRLELTYLDITNNINLEFSQSLGFKETKATFATRKPLSLGLGSVKILQNG